ncbi:MAG: preprotein translocase subunit YajC [Verrucomicrobiales bacterium]|nr:preprotein translocase subunit YajC [Verrucomicrobiales bacterium]
MITILPILAQEAAPTGGGGLGGGLIIPLLLMMAMFYFVLIRPQRKQQKAQDEMRKGIRKGDKVVTIGGIHGLVSGATDRTVSVKVADGMSIKFDRTAIASVVDSSAKSSEPAEETEEESNDSEEKKS